MHPDIIIGSLIIPVWHTLLLTGAVIATCLAACARPADFPLSRRDIFGLGAIVTIAGMFGARLLFILLNEKPADFRFADIFSLQGGFAYFGALVFALITFWIYANLKKVRLLALLDYCLPFVMLSQVFVRMGCFLAGCCYGRQTSGFAGVIFRTVDGLARHPTQLYEAGLIILIYIVMRLFYNKNRRRIGLTSFGTLALYGVGRFVVEHFRPDSPIIFMNITLAQLTCLILAAISIIAILFNFNKL